MNEASLEGMLASSIAEDVGGFCWGDGEAEYEGVFFSFVFLNKNGDFHPGELLVVLKIVDDVRSTYSP